MRINLSDLSALSDEEIQAKIAEIRERLDATPVIQQRINHRAPKISLIRLAIRLGMYTSMYPVKRTNYWPDGSETETFYLELTREQYETIAR